MNTPNDELARSLVQSADAPGPVEPTEADRMRLAIDAALAGGPNRSATDPENDPMMRDPDRWNGWWLLTATAATLLITALLALVLWMPDGTDTPELTDPSLADGNRNSADDDGDDNGSTPVVVDPSSRDGYVLAFVGDQYMLKRVSGGRLVPVDGALAAEPVPPLTDTLSNPAMAPLRVSPDGTMAISEIGEVREPRTGAIVWDRILLNRFFGLAWTPDNRLLLCGRGSSIGDPVPERPVVCVLDPRADELREITPDVPGVPGGSIRYFYQPVISPDGERVALLAVPEQRGQVFQARLVCVGIDGTGACQLIGESPLSGLFCWLSDSRHVVHVGSPGIQVVDADTGRRASHLRWADTIGGSWLGGALAPHPTAPVVAMQLIDDPGTADVIPEIDTAHVAVLDFALPGPPRFARFDLDPAASLAGWGRLQDDGVRADSIDGDTLILLSEASRGESDGPVVCATTPDGRIVPADDVTIPDPALEPDGNRRLVVVRDEDQYTVTFQHPGGQQVTMSPDYSERPFAAWIERGTFVVAWKRHSRDMDASSLVVTRFNSDGWNTVQLAAVPDRSPSPPVVSPDRRYVAVVLHAGTVSDSGSTPSGILIARLDGEGEPVIAEANPAVPHVAWRPDGSELIVAGRGGWWRINPATGRTLAEHPVELTSRQETVDLYSPVMHPDGSTVVMGMALHPHAAWELPGPDDVIDWTAGNLLLANLDTGETRRLTLPQPFRPRAWIRR